MEKVTIQPSTTQDFLAATGLVRALKEAGCEVTLDSPRHRITERRGGGFEDQLLLTTLVLNIMLGSVTLIEKVAPIITRWARGVHDRHGTRVDATILGPDGKVLKKVELEAPEED